MMKALLLVVLGAIVGTVASTPFASMDGAMELAMFNHELLMNATCRELQSFFMITLCSVYT